MHVLSCPTYFVELTNYKKEKIGGGTEVKEHKHISHKHNLAANIGFGT